jgi:hypothetical protein
MTPVDTLPTCAATIQTQVNVVLNLISLGVVLVTFVIVSRLRGITKGNAEFLAWWRRSYATPANDSTPAFNQWQEEQHHV